MAHLVIIDTGYATSLRELDGTLETRANGGDPIQLNYSSTVTSEDSASIQIEVQPGTDKALDSNYVGIENPVLNFSFNFHSDVSADQDVIKALCGVLNSDVNPGIHRTRGVKALYINGVNDTKKNIVELIGNTDTPFHTNEVPEDMPALIGRVRNFTITDEPNNNVIRIGFDFIVS